MGTDREPLRLSVASPCSARWRDMSGDERVRLCGLCQKRVYNLERLSRDEIDELILANEGRVCVRLFQRTDGTVLTADCPTGSAKWKARLQRWALRTAGAAAGLLGTGTVGATVFGDNIRKIFGASVSGGALVNTVAVTAEARARQEAKRRQVVNFAREGLEQARDAR